MTGVALRRATEQRASCWEQMMALLDAVEAEDRSMSAEENETWDRHEAKIAELDEEVGRLERSAALSERFEAIDDERTSPERESTPRRVDPYEQAFEHFVRMGAADLSTEQRSVLAGGFVAGSQLRAQGVVTDAAGGYLVPDGFRLKLTQAMLYFGGMRQVSEVITTDSGQPLPWASMDDTLVEGIELAENTQMPEGDLVFGGRMLGAFTYTSRLVRVSLQLIQDAAYNVDTKLSEVLGERLGRIQNRRFTTGTGTGQPLGIAPSAAVGKVGAAGQTVTVTMDDLVDLEHSVDVAYRAGRAQFMLHDLTLAKLRKLKDADGRYLWQPNLVVGVAPTLNAHPYTVNNHMPVMAASAKSILFGDFFAAYVIRDVRGAQLVRLGERYADFLQVGFFGFTRTDGQPDDAAAVRAYQNSAT